MNNQSFNQVLVSRSALAFNYQLLQKRAGSGTRVVAMVKADGYGHGMVEAAKTFSQAGCNGYGVAEVSEGVVLREAGVDGDILVFLGLDPNQVDLFFVYDLSPVVFSETAVVLLGLEAVKRNKDIGVHLKIDCGMGRLGVLPEQAEELVDKIEATKGVFLAGMASHFPCADDPESDNSRQVFFSFQAVLDDLDFTGSRETKSHIANSGAILYFPETCCAMVRPGISLYGYYPDGHFGCDRETAEKLRPAMSFVTRVIQVKDLPEGTGISYGHTFVTEHQTQIAVLPVGYANGYPRSLGNKADVLIQGRRAKIVGRICMNLCMVDITDFDQVEVGEEVVLLGSQGNEIIDADELGGLMGTISYEVLCLFGNLNERIMVD